MSDGWPTNDELVSLHSDLRDAARGAVEKWAFWGEELFEVVVQQPFLSEANYESIIANDPAALDELFADYSQIQAEINRTLFDEIIGELESWDGEAASNFRIQLRAIHKFLGEQALYFEEMKGCINGLLAVSSGFGPAWRVDGGKIVSLTA
jgi:hypothetical protein